MNTITNSVIIPQLDFTPKYQGDLLAYEGPLLSHFINEDNPKEHYLYKWTDCSEQYNRWLIFKLSEKDLKAFFKQQMNLLQLIRNNPFVYLIDIDSDIHTANIQLCSTPYIPTEYLPSEDSFFEEGEYEQYAQTLKNAILKEHFQRTPLILAYFKG